MTSVDVVTSPSSSTTAASADAKMVKSGRMATRDELPSILTWLDSHWPLSLFIYHQVRHTIEGSIDTLEFWIHTDGDRYLSILSRNLRWKAEHETIHVFAPVPTDIWSPMKSAMIDHPLPFPLRSAPTTTSHSFRFACVDPRYFKEMQQFVSANFVYGPGCPTTAPSFENKLPHDTKGNKSDDHKTTSNGSIVSATSPTATTPTTPSTSSSSELITPTISHYECWTYILRRLEDLKPSLLPTNWPRVAPAADVTTTGVITITGASLRSLTVDDVELVNSQWVYRNGSSTAHLRHSIANYPSVGCIVDGTITKDGVTTEFKSKLVCWILSLPDGSIGTLNTLNDYRRLGLGQAVAYDLVMKRMSSDAKHAPFLFTTMVNVASMTLFTTMGFHRLGRHDWTAADGVVLKPSKP